MFKYLNFNKPLKKTVRQSYVKVLAAPKQKAALKGLEKVLPEEAALCESQKSFLYIPQLFQDQVEKLGDLGEISCFAV